MGQGPCAGLRPGRQERAADRGGHAQLHFLRLLARHGLAAQGLGLTLNPMPSFFARWPAIVPSRATAKACSFAALHVECVCRLSSTKLCQSCDAHAGGTQDSTRVWCAKIYGSCQ